MTGLLVGLVTLAAGTHAQLPCVPSDLRARANGHVLVETYSPWTAWLVGAPAVRFDRRSRTLTATRRVSVRYWCER